MKNLFNVSLLAIGVLLAGCAAQPPAEVYADAGEAHAMLEIPGLRNYAAGPYYPALLRDIDGRKVVASWRRADWGDEDNYTPQPSDRELLRVVPGKHTLTADINRALIVANAPGSVRDHLVPDHYEHKAFDVTLEAGHHYVLSAVVPEGDYTGWYPVLLEVDDGRIVDVVAKGSP